MTEHIHIDVDLLERASAVLIQYLREQAGIEVLLDHDYYWSVPATQLHDIYQAPTDLTIGQISECMEWLGAVVKDPESALAYHLVWLGDVLRAVGQAVVK
jgi:hypothetical protein